MDIKKLFCDLATPGVKGLMPYRPGKPIEELQRELGISEVIKLASNENPLGTSQRVLDVLKSQLSELARYPDGNGYVLKQAIANHLNISIESITLGNGSNDVLELVARAFVTDAEEVIFSKYAFAVYPIVTQAVGATAVVTKDKNWGHDLDAMLAAITNRTRIIFIANPNNPTGTWLTETELKNFLAKVPQRVIVVIDEAYFEYASDDRSNAKDYPKNSLQWLERFPNLIITRTFSKAYGLAGLRIGYGISHPDAADMLNRVRQPFNANSLALCAAAEALKDKVHLENSISCNAKGLAQLAQGFEQLNLRFIPSVGNFISVDMGRNAKGYYKALLALGVIVRPIGGYDMANFLRVSVGIHSENARFLQALKSVMVQLS